MREQDFKLACPMPIQEHAKILLGHGGGGKLTQQLIEKIFLPSFDNPMLAARHDGAVFEQNGTRYAFTTDSYVVKPLFFPGGDIGSLAVYGTVNDLAMCGARPLYLSAGFILEEGFEMEKLQKIAASMREAALNAGVQLVTGDTKVVDRGKGDGVFINTSGIGVIEHSLQIHPGSIRPGDQILLSGDIGRHGIAVMASREGLEFKTSLKSDCAPMWNPVKALLEGGQEIHCLRDLTRGGLAGALNEIAQVCQMEILIHEGKIPVQEEVRGACEILGLNPFYAANEGRMIVFVPEPEAESALSLLKAQENSSGARWIGEVKQGRPGQVTAATALGTKRILEQISGEQLPRIC